MASNLTIFDPLFTDLVSSEAGFTALATGFDFLEGPIWHPIRKSVIFSDIIGNSIYEWTKDGVTKLRRNSYMANGHAYDAAGRVITCEHATSRLTRTDFANNGELEVLATHYDGKQLNSPNDVIVKSDGAIYFTDPTSGRSASYGVPREPELAFSGVYRLKDGELTLLVDDFTKPNGLCFSMDESQLLINDTAQQHIRIFDVNPDGTVSNGRLFADLEGDAPGVADGMKIDSLGNVYSCGPGGIQVFSPIGKRLGIIHTLEVPANFVFGGSDMRSLFITANTTLYSLNLNVAGLPTFHP